MSNGKTIGELIEEMRLKAGAKEYHGHEYMALERFADNTRHMIIFHVPRFRVRVKEVVYCRRK